MNKTLDKRQADNKNCLLIIDFRLAAIFSLGILIGKMVKVNLLTSDNQLDILGGSLLEHAFPLISLSISIAYGIGVLIIFKELKVSK